jgi:hypothetical protein
MFQFLLSFPSFFCLVFLLPFLFHLCFCFSAPVGFIFSLSPIPTCLGLKCLVAVIVVYKYIDNAKYLSGNKFDGIWTLGLGTVQILSMQVRLLDISFLVHWSPSYSGW